MTKSESDFLAIKALVDGAKRDPANVGWYVARAYWLGKGAGVDAVLKPPPPPEPKVELRLVR